ncbi:hypothetical protein PVAP13_9KG204185 [Panicum virgatum]|uniref:Uncharacterized protein n=1 Tax=Panicum virgatum TaxID=38727 RepID=A0A8T0NFS5_PANVG|nr:hypothetical protein PVAP13_9KG204185 [Panicum virgatum]
MPDIRSYSIQSPPCAVCIVRAIEFVIWPAAGGRTSSDAPPCSGSDLLFATLLSAFRSSRECKYPMARLVTFVSEAT